MTAHFFQRSPDSIENLCTFVTETCLTCQRYATPALRPAARPLCVMPTYFQAQRARHIDEGHPYADDLLDWWPTTCYYHLPI